jgi:hypothetical protein
VEWFRKFLSKLPIPGSTMLRHIVLTFCTIICAATLLLAAFGVGKALELWRDAGMNICIWNALMLAPATVKRILEQRLAAAAAPPKGS